MIKHIKIKDFSTVITGGTPSTSKNEYWDGGNIPWLNSGELNQDIIISTRNYITQEGLKNSSTRLMPPNTILIALTGSTTGVVGFLTFEACANQSVTGILPSKFHEPKYLYYYLKSIRKQVISDAYGGAQPHISQAYVKDLQIPLPPLETQQKIAAILDAADTLRQKDKALHAKYDELTQALFLDMFGDPVSNPKGWDIDILGNYCKKIQIGPFGSQLHMSDYVEEGIPLINPTNIKNGIIEYKSSVKITNSKYDSLPNYHLKIGDIVMARRGDLSKIGIVDKVKSFCGTGSLYLRLKENIDALYCYWLLSHKSTVEKLYEKSQGVTMANLNKGIIVKLPIVVPPLKLQKEFVNRISFIEAQKAIAKASLAKSEELFNSLLQKAFKGELV